VYRSFLALFPGVQQHYHTDNLQLLGHPVTDAVIREMIKEALPSLGIYITRKVLPCRYTINNNKKTHVLSASL